MQHPSSAPVQLPDTTSLPARWQRSHGPLTSQASGDSCAHVCQNTKGLASANFLAGTGLPLLHNLCELPCIATETVLGAIACPPRLLRFKPDANHSLHLIHCAPDGLCVWYPSKERFNSLKCKYTFVEGSVAQSSSIGVVLE